jgi:hypothetical protein
LEKKDFSVRPRTSVVRARYERGTTEYERGTTVVRASTSAWCHKITIKICIEFINENYAFRMRLNYNIFHNNNNHMCTNMCRQNFETCLKDTCTCILENFCKKKNKWKLCKKLNVQTFRKNKIQSTLTLSWSAVKKTLSSLTHFIMFNSKNLWHKYMSQNTFKKSWSQNLIQQKEPQLHTL